MSARRTSTLTLAVALLVGAAGGATAQEPFQTPLNSGATNGEGTVRRAGDSGFYQSGDYSFFIQARAIGPVFKDLSRVTAGGFGSYCASQFSPLQVAHKDEPPRMVPPTLPGPVSAPENVPSKRLPGGTYFNPVPRAAVPVESDHPKLRQAGCLVIGAIAERGQWVPREEVAQKFGGQILIADCGTVIFSGAGAPDGTHARAAQPAISNLPYATAGGFGSYCADLLPPLNHEPLPCSGKAVGLFDPLEPETFRHYAEVNGKVLGFSGSLEEFLELRARAIADKVYRTTRGGFGSYCGYLFPQLDRDVSLSPGTIIFSGSVNSDSSSLPWLRAGATNDNLHRATKGDFGSYGAVLLPRSVVAAPRRMQVVCNQGGRVHLVPAEDVLVFSDPGMQAPTPPTNPYEHRQLFGFGGQTGADLDRVPANPPERKQVFNFVLGTFGSGGPRHDAPPRPSNAVDGSGSSHGTPPAPTLPPAPPPGVAVPFADVTLPALESKSVPNPLLGTWYRDVPTAGLQVVATFTPDELKLRATQTVDGHTVTITATAHYTLTPDGLVFAAITSADVNTKSGTKAGLPDSDMTELVLTVQALADVPFSCRTKLTSAGLMVSGLKYGLSTGRNESEQLQIAFGGLLRSAKDGKVPPLVKLKPKADKVHGVPILGAAIGALTGRPTGAALGNPPSLEPGARVGVDFSANPPTKAPPAPPVCPTPTDTESFGPPFLTKIKGLDPYSPQAVPSVPPPAPARQPGVSEDGTKQMALEAFGQLLQQSGVVRPTKAADGMTLPSGRYEQYPQYFAPDPAHPLPRELADQEGASVVTQAMNTSIQPVPVLFGTWYHEAPAHGAVVAMTFTRDELQARVTLNSEGHLITIIATAHYKFTHDWVFGVITSVDVEVKGDKAEAITEKERSDLLSTARVVLEGTPFAFSTQVTKLGLKVYGAKCTLSAGQKESELVESVFNGTFRRANRGEALQPAEGKLKATCTEAAIDTVIGRPIAGPTGNVRPSIGAVSGGVGRCAVGDAAGKYPCVGGASQASTLMIPPAPPGGTPQPVFGQWFGPPVGTIPQSSPPFQNVPAVPPASPPQARQPGVSEDGTKQMALEAFGQLLQQSGVVRPTGGMVTGTGGATVPSGRCEPCPQTIAPFDYVATQATLAPLAAPKVGTWYRIATQGTVAPLAAPKAGPVGTWYRDIAGKQCVIKVTPDHLTLTVHDAQEVDGKVSIASLVITADYHITRDGITALGLITSVDVNFEGDFPPDDSKPFFEMLSDLQKSLEDKPLAMTFRTYGDSLVIGNVRMPSVSDRLDAQPAGYMAGRYKAAGDKLPKPKPTKMPVEPRAFVPNGPPPGLPVGGNPGSSLGQPLGISGGFLPPPGNAYPVIEPPLPSSNSDLLPPQRIPSAPPMRVIPSGGEDSWVPPMSQPAKPGPVRPVVEGMESKTNRVTNPITNGLLFRSESGDLHQIQNEWRRFWFDDRPSEPTPERIHGRIY